jgi:hypothetical protein
MRCTTVAMRENGCCACMPPIISPIKSQAVSFARKEAVWTKLFGLAGYLLNQCKKILFKLGVEAIVRTILGWFRHSFNTKKGRSVKGPDWSTKSWSANASSLLHLRRKQTDQHPMAEDLRISNPRNTGQRI